MSNRRRSEAEMETATTALEHAIRASAQDEKELADALLAASDGEISEEEQKRIAKLKKGLGSSRGIETMFKNIYRVQMDLTSLADNKANMMISINGIIISIIIAAVAPKLDSNPWLLIPSTIFLIGTLISIIYAILAARPRVSTKPISLADLEHSEGNILFFGNFANLEQSVFTVGLVDLLLYLMVLFDNMM